MQKIITIVLAFIMVFSGYSFLATGVETNDSIAQTSGGDDKPQQSVNRTILVEDFTSWNSIPCANFNPELNAAIENYGYGKVAPGYIHVWWPLPTTDPFYLYNPQENQDRLNFYGVTGVPDLYIDAVDYPQFTSQAQNEAYFDEQLAIPANLTIRTSGFIDQVGLTGSVNAYIEAVEPIVSTDLRVMFYLWENNVTNVGSGANGETEFKWAIWDMLPDAQGTPITLMNPGDFTMVAQNFNIDPTWNINELGVTVFVQDFSTRFVEQAAVEEFTCPGVTLLTPDPMTAEQVLNGTISISWIAADEVDPPNTLDITLNYSIDAGTTWLPIMSGTDNNNPPYLWDTVGAGILDGVNYKIRVTAMNSKGHVGWDESIELFSIDNTLNDRWYLQIESTNLAPHLDLDMKPAEQSSWHNWDFVSEGPYASTNITGPGEFLVQSFASEYVAPWTIDLAGNWTFSIFAKVSSDNLDGLLYANVSADDGTTSRQLFTTGYDDEFVGSYLSFHDFNWVYSVPSGTMIQSGEHVIVEIILHATEGYDPSTDMYYANADIPISGYVSGDYSMTQASDDLYESIEEVGNSGSGGSNVTILFEDFSGGIPPTWKVVNGGGQGPGGGADKTWVTNNPGNRTAEPPITDPFAIVDSDFHGLPVMNEELITPILNLSLATSVTLEFDQWFYDRQGKKEIADVDVYSNLTSFTWINVLSQSGTSSPNPDHQSINITSLAAGAPDVRIRFHYYKAIRAYWWMVDNVKVQAGIDTSLLEHKWTIDIPVGEVPGSFYLEAKRPQNPDGNDFVFAYSTDNITFTDMITVNQEVDMIQTYSLPRDINGTIYVRVVDTDRTPGNFNVSTVDIDQMF
ncbi:MAG: hypothetical protein KAX31_06940, partial [Thermoplasmata archaeon]|nr:hypothetical protein [Thermoplasmata archaeon]